MLIYNVDLSSKTQPFPHFWEECVGSCHAALALREDYRQQLKKCHEELGFKRVRFHGLLCDDMSVYTIQDGKPYYSFYNVDSIFEFLLKIGMQPLIELSFMPKAMASGNHTVFHYPSNMTPPNSYEEWGTLIEALTRHLVVHFGLDEVRSWYFEVWNEANLNDPVTPGFWTGTQQDYLILYEYAARAIKKVDAAIPVGGPATARNAWIPDLISYCQKRQVPLDFISTHQYPSDAALSFSDMDEALAHIDRDTLLKMAQVARQESKGYPLYYTEWSSSPSSRDHFHDEAYAAAFISKTIMDMQGLVDIYSFWAFSDIFEEGALPSTPFHGGFGLLNLYGVPKPCYRVFGLLHQLGKEQIPLVAEPHPTVQALATLEGNQIKVLVSNHQVPQAPIKQEHIVLRIEREIKRGYSENIDETHANPKQKWIEMGCPEYPTKTEIAALMNASNLNPEPVKLTKSNNGTEIEFDIPPHGVIAITLEM